MNLIVNGLLADYDELQVDASINELTRQFGFLDINNHKRFNVGDSVSVFNCSQLVIKGEIEHISVEDGAYRYTGRNLAKYIIDNYSTKTIQMSQNNNLKRVLEEVAKQFGLKIQGNAVLPKDTKKLLNIGDKYSSAIIEVAKLAKKIVYSDEVGNLIIAFESDGDTNEIIKYGVNGANRKYEEDYTGVYDEYIVISQSNYTIKGKDIIDIQGKYGDGKFTKVIKPNGNLDAKEAKELAETEYKKDVRKSFKYNIELDFMPILNKKYMVIDEDVGIIEKLNCKSYSVKINANDYIIKAEFERLL